jgi:methylmalonyl-CoA epimerase
VTLGRINHIGVATPSIEQSIALYRDLLGATNIGEPFDLPPQKVRVCFVDTPNSQIELLEPLGADSPIAKSCEKRTGGRAAHACFEVPGTSRRPGRERMEAAKQGEREGSSERIEGLLLGKGSEEA